MTSTEADCIDNPATNVPCDLSLLVTVQAAFLNLFLAKTSSWSVFRSSVSNHRTQLQHAGHEPVCLVPGQCLPMPAWTLRISIDTHSEGFLLC